MPLLSRWLQQHQFHADSSEDGIPTPLPFQPPLNAGAAGRVIAIDPATLGVERFDLRIAAGRRHLASFLGSPTKLADEGNFLSSLATAPRSGSRQTLGSSFLSTESDKLEATGNEAGMTMKVLPPRSKRARLHIGGVTAFNSAPPNDPRFDVMAPMDTFWIMTYRALYLTGLGCMIAGSIGLDKSVEERSKRKIDAEPAPGHARAFGGHASEEARQQFRTMEDMPPQQVIDATGLDEDGLRIIGDKVVRYDAFMMLRPLRRFKHTILDEAAVWQMQCTVMIPFFIFAILTMESTHAGKGIYLWVFQDILMKDGPTARIGDFVKSLTAFTSFFLGLFTSISLGRNQSVWQGGIMQVFQAAEKLTVMLACDLPASWTEVQDPSQPPREVNRDEMLTSFGRWAQASILFLFEKYGRQQDNEAIFTKCKNKGLLNDEEVDKLREIPEGHALALWSWHFKFIHKAQTSKLLSIPMQPMHIVHNTGIFGITNVMENVRQPLPYSYISIIAMFVKFMNMSVSVSGGILCSRALMYGSEIEALLQLLFAALVPLITNAIVILNLNMSTPLKDHFTGMSPDDILVRLDKACATARMGPRKAPQFLEAKWEPKAN